jgi:MoaA/NifB/PqqE/SkfB family radical SAM enzyme
MNPAEYEVFEPSREMPFMIEWQPGNTCNFKCSYCTPSTYNGSLPWQTYEDSIRFITYLWETVCVPDDKPMRFNINGGEPTLWPALKQVCAFIKTLDDRNTIQLVTNGTRGKDWWLSMTGLLDTVIVSVHHGQSNNQRLSEKFNLVEDAGINVSFHVMLDLAYFDECIETYMYLYTHNKNSKLSGMPLREDITSRIMQAYSDEQKLQIKNLPRLNVVRGEHALLHPKMQFVKQDGGITACDNIEKELVLTQHDNWEGWYCNVTTEMVCINNRGDIKPASGCFNNIIFGNIRDKEYSRPSLPIKCKFDKCKCGTDLQTKKRKHIDEDEEYIDASIHTNTYQITTRNK